MGLLDPPAVLLSSISQTDKYAAPSSTTINAQTKDLSDNLSDRYAPIWRHKWLRNYEAAAAKALAGTGLCTIVCAGDSTWEGTGATDYTKTMPYRLAELLARRTGKATPRGYVAAVTTSMSGIGSLVQTGWAGTGTMTCVQNFSGLNLYLNVMASASTLTQTVTCDRFQVHYAKQNFAGRGIVTVNVDGTDIGTFTCDGTGLGWAANELRGGYIFDSGALSGGLAAHVVKLTCTGTSAVVEGVYFEAGNHTDGFRVYNAAHASFSTTHYMQNQTNTGIGCGWVDGLDAITPNLVLWGMGLNDVSTGTDLEAATHLTNTQTAMDYIRAHTTTSRADLCVVVPHVGKNNNSTTWQKFRLNYYKTGFAKSVNVIDHFNLIGSVSSVDGSTYSTTGGTNGTFNGVLYTTDGVTVHLNDAGSYELALGLARQLAGVVPVTPDGIASVATPRTLGTGALQAAAGNDSRLSDTRTPTDLSVTTGKIADGAVTAAKMPTAALKTDPLGMGFGFTLDPRTISSTSTTTANQGWYMRYRGGGPITKIGIHVGASSGNICLAAYSNTGVGRNARPGTRIGTTGSVVCPTANAYAEVALLAEHAHPGRRLAVLRRRQHHRLHLPVRRPVHLGHGRRSLPLPELGVPRPVHRHPLIRVRPQLLPHRHPLTNPSHRGNHLPQRTPQRRPPPGLPAGGALSRPGQGHLTDADWPAGSPARPAPPARGSLGRPSPRSPATTPTRSP